MFLGDGLKLVMAFRPWHMFYVGVEMLLKLFPLFGLSGLDGLFRCISRFLVFVFVIVFVRILFRL